MPDAELTKLASYHLDDAYLWFPDQSRVSEFLLKGSLPWKCRSTGAKGYTSNCVEPFALGHRCKRLFLIDGSGVSEDVCEESHSEQKPVDVEAPTISLHAICGSTTPQTMRVIARIEG